MPKPRILIVEDESIVAKDIQTRLKLLGYSAATAGTAKDAIASASEACPDLALMDIRLKGKEDGIAVAAELRERFDVPVIYLTAYADNRTLARAKHTAPYGYLLKPFDDKELGTSIEMALNKHKLDSELRKSEGWCRAILRAIADAVVVTDTKGRVTYLNPVAERLTGWPADQARGKALSGVFTLLSEDGRTPVKISVAKMLRGEGPGDGTVHAILQGRTGKETHVDSTASRLEDCAGDIVGIVMAFRDITERHMMGKQILSQQKMQAVGTLARGIAHDFGNLVGIISTYASSMADSLISKSRAHEDALRIVEASRHAHALTDRLLSMARASHPASEHKVAPVQLSTVISDTMELLQGTISESNIEVRVRNAERMPYAQANRSQLLDLLMNVFLNSIDAMPDGGTITVSTTTRSIAKPSPRLNANAKGGTYVLLRISDTGNGMGRDILDRVFEPFFTTKGTGGAKGLGLTVAHSAAHGWGGWIRARSEPGEGTSMTVYIPHAESRPEADPEVSHKGKTLLVVDDNKNHLDSFRTTLLNAGYKVITACDADSALGEYTTHRDRISATLLDLMMPEKNGKHVLAGLLELNTDASVILTSGFSRDYARNVVGHGGWNFVQKPVEEEHLLLVVNRVLGQLSGDTTSE